MGNVLASSSLTSLNLPNNNIGDAGASSLANVLPSTSLTSLNFCFNFIGDAGTSSLANVIASTYLTTLDVSSNNVIADNNISQLIRDGVAANKLKAQQRRR